MNPFYTLGIRLYALGARVAAFRSAKVRKMIAGQRESISRIREALGSQGCDLWIHAASLGEFEQGRPLIERYRRENPDAKILLTFFSPSGYEVRKNYDKVDVVAYLPFDTPELVSSFLDAASPRMAIMVKYEIWGNYLRALAQRHIPVYLISAVFRPGQIYFRWKSLGDFLKCFTHIFVQDQNSAALVAPLNQDVSVAGDTRFDRVTDVMRSTFSIPAFEDFKDDDTRVIIAGSSWPADEELYIPWYASNRDKVKLIIAPHEFDNQRLGKLLSSFEPGEAALLSDFEKRPASEREGVRVVIVDSFGKLSSIYRYGDIAYIGGGFGAGIHNINEAAVYGMPVVFGPRNEKFIEARELAACGGGFPVSSAAEVSSVLSMLVSDRDKLFDSSRKAASYIRSKIGATDIIYDKIFLNKNREND